MVHSVDVISKVPRKGEKSIYELLGKWIDLQTKYSGEVYAEEFGPMYPRNKPRTKPKEVPSLTEVVLFQSEADANGFVRDMKKRYGTAIKLKGPIGVSR